MKQAELLDILVYDEISNQCMNMHTHRCPVCLTSDAFYHDIDAHKRRYEAGRARPCYHRWVTGLEGYGGFRVCVDCWRGER